MSENNSNENMTLISKMSQINQVEGFEASAYAVKKVDKESGEITMYLPITVQMAWFRLKYPTGKIAVQVAQNANGIQAKARIYPDYKDSPESYLAEASAFQNFTEEKSTALVYEEIQDKAVSIALMNAGFGMLIGMSVPGAVIETQAGGSPAVRKAEEAQTVITKPQKPMTMEEKYRWALQQSCPLNKYANKTLGEVAGMDPKAIKWIWEKYTKNPEIQEAAGIIFEYAAQQASA